MRTWLHTVPRWTTHRRNPKTARPKNLTNKVIRWSRWVFFTLETKVQSRSIQQCWQMPLDIKRSLKSTFHFFAKDSNFNCLSAVPLVKHITHNVWAEETSSAACSLCLKLSFPWVTERPPHFDSCAPSETEKETSEHYLCLFAEMTLTPKDYYWLHLDVSLRRTLFL